MSFIDTHWLYPARLGFIQINRSFLAPKPPISAKFAVRLPSAYCGKPFACTVPRFLRLRQWLCATASKRTREIARPSLGVSNEKSRQNQTRQWRLLRTDFYFLTGGAGGTFGIPDVGYGIG